MTFCSVRHCDTFDLDSDLDKYKMSLIFEIYVNTTRHVPH